MPLPKVIKGRAVRPRRVLLYAPHGTGKSTWGAQAPKPLVIATEDGLDDIGVDRTPLLRKTMDVAHWLIELGGPDDHGYQSVVIDTVDWLEKLIWKATCEDGGKKSIEEFGYGKGYKLALARWEQLLLMLDCCRDKGMNVILLAHAKVEKFSPPDADAYDRWQLDLHKEASALLQEWADEILFATQRVSVIESDEPFGHTSKRAVGNGERIVYTSPAPTHVAKRRIPLPDTLPLAWSEYQQHWPTGNGSAGNINGVVKDGHSKKEKANG